MNQYVTLNVVDTHVMHKNGSKTIILFMSAKVF